MNNDNQILIVDDDRSLCQSFSDYFEDNKWRVRIALSGEKALSLLNDINFDYIIADIRLGGITGEQMIRNALKMNIKSKFLICTAISDYLLPDDLKAIDNVLNTVLIKPIYDITELDRLVTRRIAE